MGDKGQLTSSAAEIYDQFFLPALFSDWAPRVVEAAELQPGMRVLDVACGTGVLTIEAHKAVAPGAAVGIDLNAGMLAVARRKAPHIDWHQAPAERLPFAEGSFDAVVSQFGLMFFEDRPSAVREALRVLEPGGKLTMAVWDSLENTPGYAASVALISRLFGDDTADLLRAPYSLGSKEKLRSLFADAGVRRCSITRLAGRARFPSIRSWLHTDVRGWTLGDRIDDRQFERLAAAAEQEFTPFVGPDGSVSFSHPALISVIQKDP